MTEQQKAPVDSLKGAEKASSINYIVGNLLTAAIDGEVNAIAQQLNCFNTRKSGIAPQIDKLFPRMGEVDDSTLKGNKEKLGRSIYAVYSTEPRPVYNEQVLTKVEQDHCNMIVFGLYGQYHWNGRQRGERDTDYKALRSAFKSMQTRLCYYLDKDTAIVGLPLIGCGLAGGDWEVVSKVIEEELCSEGWKVNVYVLTQKELDNIRTGE